MLEKILFASFFVWALIAKCQISYFCVAWLRAYFLKPTRLSYKIDMRQNIYRPGKTIKFCAIKTDPKKGVWFGHVWIVWPEGEQAARHVGFYPQCRRSALLGLVFALLSPFSLLFGNKPTKSTIINDGELIPDWELCVRIDDAIFAAAEKIDNNWQSQSQYQLFASFDRETINCRDYVFDVAREIGLLIPKDTKWEMPPISFVNFINCNIRPIPFTGCSFYQNRSMKAA